LPRHFIYAILAYVKSDRGGEEPAATRDDVVVFELLTRALIGIALESIQVAGGQVTLPQFRLLLALEGLGRVPSSRLAAQLGLAPSAITRMVDRLQQRGLVKRGVDERSRCIVTVQLTGEGSQLVTAVLARRHERLAAVLDEMSPGNHAAAVRAARQFTRLSGDAIALGESGPVPL
jgi:DNA-binding MarR family transcriptional regulator